MRPPQVSLTAFSSSIRRIYTTEFVQYWTLSCSADLSALCCLICDFYSSNRGFASSFFQIPPRSGHPCSWLTVPTAKPVADFHRRTIRHVGHTLNVAVRATFRSNCGRPVCVRRCVKSCLPIENRNQPLQQTERLISKKG